MLYQIQDGTVSVGGETVLFHFDFEIRGREKIAVVGKNGAGKTTLLRLIAGELDLDRDDRRVQPGLRTSRKVTVGLLPQQVFSGEGDDERTVEEELLRACPCKDTWDRERFLYEQEYDRLFTGFGFEKKDKQKKLAEFSGGQRTRIALIRLMLEKPDILLLDEPTNHLDQEMTEWLEQWIVDYEKAVVVVSHDRFFLDRTAESVYEITGRKLVRYAGNYSCFVEQKEKNQQLLRREWERQQAEIERLNELIRKFRGKPRKAAFARSRQKLLERMDRMEKPSDEVLRPFVQEIVPEVTSAKYVLEAEHLQIGYDHALLELGLRIRRGQKIGVIGPNGIGKSTFLKTAAGLLPPVSGKCTQGLRVTMEYFDQQTASIQADCSVMDHFHRLYPSMTDKEVRSMLGRWLFGGKEASRQVSELSGGEKSRLMFAEIFQSCPNFMILDEPTNHMDIQAREMLESAFRAYQGTLLFVSHDRYFISQVADALLVFEKDRVIYYPFGYRHYLEKKKKAEKYARLAAEKAGSAGKAEEMCGDPREIGIRAEDQALVDEMRSVPEAEKGRFMTISTEQAYREWRMRLMGEELDRLAERVLRTAAQMEEQEQSKTVGILGYGTEKIPEEAEQETFQETESDTVSGGNQDILPLSALEQAEAEWTEACIAWDEEFSDAGEIG